ncbi:MAG: family 20 glycosylhydrolase [Saprospiraceae bacterium]|nr:family 20 glycosylhydrolase [Saprospiraceae bacterium]
MRTLSLILSLTILASCSEKAKKTSSWPDAKQLKVEWKILDDAVKGDNKYTSEFIITNESNSDMPSGWQLYFSQLPTSFYLPANADGKYDIMPQGGDFYRISTLASFPNILPGQSFTIRYQWQVNKISRSFTPHGLFFVLPDHSVVNVTNYVTDATPESISFDNNGTDESVYMDSEKRFKLYENIQESPLDATSPIIPTPRQMEIGQGDYPVFPGIRILFDKGLDTEAEQLTGFIQGVLKAAANPNESEQAIYLKLDGDSGKYPREGYQLEITADRIAITGSDAAGVYYGIQSLKALIPADNLKTPGDQILLPRIKIVDSPRFQYRGQHIDVARNFQPLSEIKKIIDVMSFYKLNKLHFHLTDDEGWRLQIPGLPELTDVGGHRGFSPEPYALLPPAYGSGGSADSSVSTGSGYYTREEYIDLLKYATKHHIEVIPEINGPGHARAAIVAMLHRYQRFVSAGNKEEAVKYLLSDQDDASQYSSAQNYHDNVICVCQESTYTFLEKVIDEVVKMYREADAPLHLIHTGGDEVPHGAWSDSPKCASFIQDNSEINSTGDLHPYFVGRYLDIAKKYDLDIGGWEEITLKHLGDRNVPNPEFLGKGVVSYAWNAIVGGGGEDMSYQLANAGYEVVMCNASNLYFDLAYTYETQEPGLSWAGFIDTKNAFELTPSNIFMGITEDELGNPIDGLALARERVRLKPEAQKNIIGIQGALWSETLKSRETAEYMLLPKMLGLAERAWAEEPLWTKFNNAQSIRESIASEWSKFANRIGKRELPRLDHLDGGFSYRISPPGAKIENGVLFINSEFPGLVLRYTVDGSEPTAQSILYKGPVDLTKDVSSVKVKAFTTNDRESRIVEVKMPALN